jgi:hypothetical protein
MGPEFAAFLGGLGLTFDKLPPDRKLSLYRQFEARKREGATDNADDQARKALASKFGNLEEAERSGTAAVRLQLAHITGRTATPLPCAVARARATREAEHPRALPCRLRRPRLPGARHRRRCRRQDTGMVRGGSRRRLNITPTVLPEGIDDFVALVVRELQRRGLFRTEYEDSTLRENLGLRRPVSRYATSHYQWNLDAAK